MKPILNIADAPETFATSHGDAFGARLAALAQALGARDIGANVTTVPPGKAAFPLHHHHGNEEHFFIVRGTGVLRHGAERHAVRPGDYIVTLPGGPERAHQLVNTGAEELVYLSLSTLRVPEVVGYPDSGKTGVRIGDGPQGRFLLEDAARNADYWKGEDGAAVRALLDE